MFEGYLELGGGEVLNSARALGYATTAPCPVNWLQCPPCDGIRDVLGDDQYTYANIMDAPWYDVEDEITHRFLGAHAISVEGLPDSTREASVAEAMLDGGVVGRVRHATRRMRYRAILTAQGEDALESGFAWLNSALTPGECGTHGDGCGAADMQVFTACPPERADITMPETFWNDSIENLATNPSMETAGAAVAVRTNLATNPSFEATTAATVEVRRNVSNNPTAIGAGGWIANPGTAPGAATPSRVTGLLAAGFPVDNGFRSTWTVSPGAANGGIYTDAVMTPVLPGITYTGSVYYSLSVAQRIYMTIEWKTAGGSAISTTTGIQNARSAGVVYRESLTAIAPANAALAIVTVYAAPGTGGQPWPVGAMLTVTGVLMEASPVVGTYFDGSTLPAGDFTHAWTGTANASASVQYGLGVEGATSNDAGSITATEWASTGTRSVRTIPNSASAISVTYPAGSGGFTYGMQAGKTYTAQVKCRLSAPLAGTLWADSRMLVIQYQDSADGLWKYVRSVAAPNVAGVHTLFVTAALPVTAVSAFIYLANGASQGGGDVWWDDLLVVEGTYTGPYFDGSTPAKVRRNRVSRTTTPALTAIGATSSIQPVQTTIGLVDARKATGTGSWFAVSSSTSWGANAVGSLVLEAGQTVRFSALAWSDVAAYLGIAKWRASDNGFITDVTLTTPAVLTNPNGTWLTATYTAGPVAEKVALAVRAGGGAGLSIWATAFMAETDGVAGTEATWFDIGHPLVPYAAAWEGTPDASPSYLTDPDFTYAWTGTANASTSEQRAPSVIAVAPATPWGSANVNDAASAQIASTHWTASRSRSLRIVPLGAGNDTGAQLPMLLTPGMTFTVAATIHLEAPQTGILHERARRIMFGNDVEGWGAVRMSDAAPNAAGATRLSVTFTVPATATATYLRLYNGASAGNDVWWDDLMLIEGNYAGGPYFDGSFPDSPVEDFEVIGKRVEEYEWTGAPDASTSTYRTGSIVAVPDPVEYERIVTQLVRNLHTVTCVSGPIIEQKLHRGDTWGYIVEFVLVAAVPWMFGITKPVDLQPSIPIVVQDVPFNLVPYPSAELESGTVVAAKNFSTNPSVEIDTTLWNASGNIATHALSRTTELASVGVASAKSLITTAAAGSGNYTWLEHTVDLPGITPTTRLSFNVWGSASVESGTAELAELALVAVWWNGATYITEEVLATQPASGGAMSARSVLPPAGTTKVTIRVRLGVASWAAGAKIRLYADAAAVTVP